jgi:DNA-binding response OmpR family regulator
MKIFIIENDPVFSSLLMEHLRYANHEVYLFDSIHPFGSSHHKMEPEVILTDLMLFGVSSGELIDFYRQFSCPVYVMSSIDEDDLRYFASRIGAKSYFHKPFYSEKFIEELNEMEKVTNDKV